MGRPHAYVLALIVILVAAGWFLFRDSLSSSLRDRAGPTPDTTAAVDTGPGARPGADGETAAELAAATDAPAGSGLIGGPAAPMEPERAEPGAEVHGDVVYTDRDVAVFRETMTWARRERLDTLPIGEIMVAVGRRFVGAPYIAHTLDLPGPERLVVNLRAFDCVTFVENTLALSRMVRDHGADPDDFTGFTDELRRIRYRDGRIDGYTSRLHYFSDWIADNARLGLVRDITEQLGGQPVTERIDFMSTHADAYPQLDGHPERVERIRAIERRLSQRTRYYIPQGEIGGIVQGIHDGDIIAATSTVAGLDVAHTGIALWIDGALHLMHAPLVGKDVQISAQPLAKRILRIPGQDGIMVARPL